MIDRSIIHLLRFNVIGRTYQIAQLCHAFHCITQRRKTGPIGICEENGLVRSMSAKGCSPDNSACEGFFGRLKNEFFHYRDWEGVTAGEFMGRLEAYLVYYREERIKKSLGWLSPMEYRRKLGYA